MDSAHERCVRSYNISTTAQPGDSISFYATELTNYYGIPEITGAINMTVTGSAKVYLLDGTSQSISISDLGEIVWAWGTVGGLQSSCGSGWDCYDYSYGSTTTTLRVSSSGGIGTGDCVQVAAPLDAYSTDPRFNEALNRTDWVIAY